ncbi:hypothetical protein CGRA01v4_06385 [Colletotrichum graminicola]|nr:hypothetical protein CGRA01v4_06385 [Colletotrichum graminicola]
MVMEARWMPSSTVSITSLLTKAYTAQRPIRRYFLRFQLTYRRLLSESIAKEPHTGAQHTHHNASKTGGKLTHGAVPSAASRHPGPRPCPPAMISYSVFVQPSPPTGCCRLLGNHAHPRCQPHRARFRGTAITLLFRH